MGAQRNSSIIASASVTRPGLLPSPIYSLVPDAALPALLLSNLGLSPALKSTYASHFCHFQFSAGYIFFLKETDEISFTPIYPRYCHFNMQSI